MILSIAINVDKIISEVNTTYYFYMEDITNTNIQLTGGYPDPLSDIEITSGSGHVDTMLGYSGNGILLQDGQNASLYEDDGGSVVIDDHIITLTGDVDIAHSDILLMLQKGIITRINDGIESNLLFVYRLNSERNVVNKSLILVDIINGYFRNSVNVKNPSITIQDFKIKDTFNYVYICALKRYYYVDSVEISTKNMTLLSLTEDVLMSHKDLIYSQTAFINRNENDYNAYLTDNRRAYKETPIITYVEYSTGSYFDTQPVAGGQDPVCFILEVVRGD